MTTIIQYFTNNEPEKLRCIKFVNNFENDTHRAEK